MKRQIAMEEISDGKFYTQNDLVKVGCDDCKGCSDCCRGMGSSIVLDPLDVYRLCSNLRMSFEQLLAQYVELQVVDGIILPNLKMDATEEKCSFLNEEGRCSIHSFRPGICRLFPLGRFYENGSFSYFLQVHECTKKNRTKVKVKKWLDTPELSKYEEFVTRWHYFLLNLQDMLDASGDDELRKQVSVELIKQFFIVPYTQETDFYRQFEERLLDWEGAWKERTSGT